MTISGFDLLLYCGALAGLFLTPGPVWVALVARALAGGIHAAWPLAVGVVIGDILWPLLAILGASWIAASFAGFMSILKGVAAAVFLAMGVMLIRNANKPIHKDARLTRPGMWAGFAAGVTVILGNPKAVLFYMGVLPGFFDLAMVTRLDIAAIVTASVLVPLLGNLGFAVFIDRTRQKLQSPRLLRRMNFTAGGLLCAVGCVIPFT